MAETSTSTLTAVQWRRLTRVLWVGRRDGRHVGMIEQGREYVATDDTGAVRGRFRDLAQAESLFDADLPEVPAPGAPQPRRAWPYLTGGGILLVGAAAASAALLLH